MTQGQVRVYSGDRGACFVPVSSEGYCGAGDGFQGPEVGAAMPSSDCSCHNKDPGWREDLT